MLKYQNLQKGKVLQQVFDSKVTGWSSFYPSPEVDGSRLAII